MVVRLDEASKADVLEVLRSLRRRTIDIQSAEYRRRSETPSYAVRFFSWLVSKVSQVPPEPEYHVGEVSRGPEVHSLSRMIYFLEHTPPQMPLREDMSELIRKKILEIYESELLVAAWVHERDEELPASLRSVIRALSAFREDADNEYATLGEVLSSRA